MGAVWHRSLKSTWGSACLLLLVAFSAVLWAQSQRALFPFSGDNQHLRSLQFGAQSRNIAQAILRGEGYSNPFDEPTGPTAWMAPVMTYQVLLVFWLSEPMPSAALPLMSAFQAMECLFFVFVTFRLACEMTSPPVAAASVGVFLLAYREHLLLTTNDTMVAVPAMTIALGTLHQVSNRWSYPSSFLRGVAGGFVWLCSPAIGFAWTMTLLWWRGRSWRSLIATMIGAILTVSPWLIHCHRSLGHIVPIKSNAGFELWQSQVVDDDGLLDGATMTRHPNRIGGAVHRARIREIGEVAFCREKMWQAIDAIKDQPLDYLSRVARRALAALVIPSRQDSVSSNGPSVRYPIAALRLAVLGSFVLSLMVVSYHLSKLFQVACWLWLLTLLPYVLTSVLERYVAMTIPAQVLILCEGCNIVVERFQLFRNGR